MPQLRVGELPVREFQQVATGLQRRNSGTSTAWKLKIYAVSTQFMPLGLKEWITSVCVLRKEGELVADMMLKIWACPTLSSSFHLEQNAAHISNELTNDLII